MCFFSKQKAAYNMRISDWSSDVCSSDLAQHRPRTPHRLRATQRHPRRPTVTDSDKRDHANTKPGVIRHSVLGVIALAVAALDFTIGTTPVITAGISALTVSVYSFRS